MIQQVIEPVFFGLVSGSVYTLVALGLTLVYGILGIVNFAHGEIFMIGSFITYFLLVQYGLPYPLALVVAMLLCAGIGIALERLAFRPLRHAPPINALICSLGLAIFLSSLAANVWGSTPHFFPGEFAQQLVPIGTVSFSFQRLIIFVVSLLLIAALYVFIQRTLMGKAMRATSQDMEATQLMGVDVDRIIVLTFAIGSALAGAAGGLLSPLLSIDPYIGTMVGLKAFTVIILGGFGNVQGTIAAGFIIGLTENLAARFVSASYYDSIAFAILILVLIVRPTGIFKERLEENV